MSSKRALFERWQKAQPPPQDPASPQSGKPYTLLEALNCPAQGHSIEALAGGSAAPAGRSMLPRVKHAAHGSGSIESPCTGPSIGLLAGGSAAPAGRSMLPRVKQAAHVGSPVSSCTF